MLDNSFQGTWRTLPLPGHWKDFKSRNSQDLEQSMNNHKIHGVVERLPQTTRLASDLFVIHLFVLHPFVLDPFVLQPFVLHLSAIHLVVLRRTLFRPSCL